MKQLTQILRKSADGIAARHLPDLSTSVCRIARAARWVGHRDADRARGRWRVRLCSIDYTSLVTNRRLLIRWFSASTFYLHVLLINLLLTTISSRPSIHHCRHSSLSLISLAWYHADRWRNSNITHQSIWLMCQTLLYLNSYVPVRYSEGPLFRNLTITLTLTHHIWLQWKWTFLDWLS